jgi:class 3 adenylate cyclase/Tfp pilus assembly protein PilF
VWRDTSLHDTVRVRALGHYSWTKFLFTRPDSAIWYGEVMYDFAKERGLVKWMGWALRGQGVAYRVRGEHARALELWLQSMELSQAANDPMGVAGSINNIAMLYEELGDLGNALAYHRRSLALREAGKDHRGITASLRGIADILHMQGQLDSAEAYLRRSIELDEMRDDDHGVALAYKYMGDVYRARGDLITAMEHYERALSILRTKTDHMMLAECLTAMGLVQLDRGAVTQALAACHEALDLAVAASDRVEERSACLCLHKAYVRTGDRDRALKYLERATVIADSLRLADVARQLQRMEFTKLQSADSVVRSEREQRHWALTQAALAREKGRRNVLLLVAVLVVILAGGLWSRLRYIRRSRALIWREKDLSENLLLNILPKEVAEELKTKGFVDARHFDDATILFSDFEDFTRTSERLTPQELVEELNACFMAFDRIMAQYGIEKIKTIGDAYMAAAGLSGPSTTGAVQAVRAGLDMQAFMERYNAGRRELDKPGFGMRLGIHTGPVVAGIVGVKKFQYDIWGDTVNTASRMESSGEVGKVNISEATYALVKNDGSFTFTPRGKVQAKGKGEMEMYFVTRA